jgi:hypothetical protein
LRHTLFHLQLAASPLLLPADSSIRTAGGGSDNDDGDDGLLVDVLNYDERVRGNPVETDLDHALKEINDLDNELERWATESEGEEEKEGGQGIQNSSPQGNQLVKVAFSMSVDSSSQFTVFNSTLSRELAFASHHALHHLAMMKIIATSNDEIGLRNKEFPGGFGKAPATVLFEGRGKQ